MSEKLIGWAHNGTLYWAGSLDEFVDIYERLIPYNRIVYLGDDPYFKYVHSNYPLEKIIKDSGIEFVKEGDRYIVNSKEDAKKLWNILRLEEESPNIYYKKGDKTKKYLPIKMYLSLFLFPVSMVSLLVGVMMYAAMHTSTEFGFRLNSNNYTFENKTPVEKVDFEIYSKNLQGWLDKIIIKNETEDLLIWKFHDENSKDASILLKIYPNKIMSYSDDSGLAQVVFNKKLKGEYDIIVNYGVKTGRSVYYFSREVGKLNLVSPPSYNITKIGDFVKLKIESNSGDFVTPGLLSLRYEVNNTVQACLNLNGTGTPMNENGERWLNTVNITYYGDHMVMSFKDPKNGDIYLYFARDEENKSVEI